jgi:Ca2+-binding RTX toxin-like protein
MLPGAALGGDGDNNIDLSAAATPDGSGYYISGAYGNDTLTGSAGSDELEGGVGADSMTGGDGEDEFYFEQGDSPTLVFTDNGDTVLSDGDTFTFNGLAGDVITDFNSGDIVELSNVYTDYYWSSNLSGIVSDSSYALVTGDYADGVFTVNEASGTDTLVVYDGDSTTLSATQTGLVIQGKTVGALNYSDTGEITVA